MMKTTTMGQLSEIYDNLPEGEVILDVRGADEFAAGHIPGALNAPHDRIQDYFETLRSKTAIYIHCRSGGRAQVAFAALQAAGINALICVSDGGMPQWESSGLPVEKG
jgi:rhodanese-related sulfurtransferase